MVVDQYQYERGRHPVSPNNGPASPLHVLEHVLHPDRAPGHPARGGSVPDTTSLQPAGGGGWRGAGGTHALEMGHVG